MSAASNLIGRRSLCVNPIGCLTTRWPCWDDDFPGTSIQPTFRHERPENRLIVFYLQTNYYPCIFGLHLYIVPLARWHPQLAQRHAVVYVRMQTVSEQIPAPSVPSRPRAGPSA